MQDLEKNDFPVVEWGGNTIYISKNKYNFSLCEESEFNRIRDICLNRIMMLGTSRGTVFRVVDIEPVLNINPIMRLFGLFKVRHILSDPRVVDLDQFKELLKSAVKGRQRGEFDSDFVSEFARRVEGVKTYKGMIGCLPHRM